MTADDTVQDSGEVEEPGGDQPADADLETDTGAASESDHAEEPTAEEPTAADVETGTGAASESGDADLPESDDPPVTSPALDHLDDTIKEARQAADQALAPQRDE